MDFNAIPPPGRTLVFTAGSMMGDLLCTNIIIRNDNVLEMSGEQFFANIVSDDAEVIDPQASITLTEPNDDGWRLF